MRAKQGAWVAASVLAAAAALALGAGRGGRTDGLRAKPVPSPALESEVSSVLQRARERDQRALLLLTSNRDGLGPVALVEGVLSDTEVGAAMGAGYALAICRVADHEGPTHLAWQALYAEFTGRKEVGQQLYPALLALTPDRKCLAWTVPDDQGRSTVEKVKAHVLDFLSKNAPPPKPGAAPKPGDAGGKPPAAR